MTEPETSEPDCFTTNTGETRLKSDGTNRDREKTGSCMMAGWGHCHLLIHLFDHPSNHKLESSQQSQGAWQEYTPDRSAVYQRAHRDTDMCTHWQALNVLVIELWEETRVPEVSPKRLKKAAKTQQRYDLGLEASRYQATVLIPATLAWEHECMFYL